MLIFIVAVIVLGLFYAFHDVQLLNPLSGVLIGLKNLDVLSHDAAFYRALGSMLWWIGALVFLQFVLGLILAILLDKPFASRGGWRQRCKPDAIDTGVPGVMIYVTILAIFLWLHYENFCKRYLSIRRQTPCFM